MAYFNEENTVEQMLINAAGKCGWIYVEPQEVPRLPDEVMVTEWLVTALKKFNNITDDQAAQVIYRLRAACSIGNNHEELIKKIRGRFFDRLEDYLRLRTPTYLTD